MPLWEIEAVVPPGDPRWLDHKPWRSVLVRAPSSTAARLLAATLEAKRAVGNESSSGWTCFSDEKLYWVRQVTGVGAEEDGPDAVLAASPLSSH